MNQSGFHGMSNLSSHLNSSNDIDDRYTLPETNSKSTWKKMLAKEKKDPASFWEKHIFMGKPLVSAFFSIPENSEAGSWSLIGTSTAGANEVVVRQRGGGDFLVGPFCLLGGGRFLLGRRFEKKGFVWKLISNINQSKGAMNGADGGIEKSRSIIGSEWFELHIFVSFWGRIWFLLIFFVGPLKEKRETG